LPSAEFEAKDKPRMTPRAALALTALGLAAASPARADPAADAQRADALFQQGKDAMGRGDLATACTDLGESERLDPAAGTLLNLAEREERSGKRADALAHVREALGMLPPDDFSVPFAKKRVAELEAAAPAPGPPAASPPPPAPVSHASPQRTVGVVVAGGGVIAAVLGAVFAFEAKSTYDAAMAHCPGGPSSCDPQGVQGGQDAHSQATVSTVAFILGGAMLAGGAWLYFTAPSSAVQVSASASGVRIGGSF
jgi:hypothetical protein